MAAWSGIDLTTMRQQSGQMVEAAVEILKKRIDQPDTPPEFRLEPGKLIIRHTVRLDRSA